MKRRAWGIEGGYLRVLTESDPHVNLVHGLPEHESGQRHPEKGRHSHHPDPYFFFLLCATVLEKWRMQIRESHHYARFIWDCNKVGRMLAHSS